MKSRLHIRKGGDRPPRKEDNHSTSKPNSSLNEVDQHIINQPPRVRNPGAKNPAPAPAPVTAANTAADVPTTRGIDPPEDEQTPPPVTLSRGN